MDEYTKETENGFPARFKRFLTAENISVGRLAALISSDEEQAKNNRVKIGRWISAKASPSYEGLVEIAKKYELNLNWLMMGVGEMKLTAPVEPVVLNSVPAVAQSTVDKSENVKLLTENAGLKEQIHLLKVENEKVWRLVLPKEALKELDFLKSDSQLTAEEFAKASQEHRNRIGFEYAQKLGASDEAIEDLLSETKVLPLNSRQKAQPMEKQA